MGSSDGFGSSILEQTNVASLKNFQRAAVHADYSIYTELLGLCCMLYLNKIVFASDCDGTLSSILPVLMSLNTYVDMSACVDQVCFQRLLRDSHWFPGSSSSSWA